MSRPSEKKSFRNTGFSKKAVSARPLVNGYSILCFHINENPTIAKDKEEVKIESLYRCHDESTLSFKNTVLESGESRLDLIVCIRETTV